ncbi:hypothetical protein WOLCODRAFT_22481 [Wolfiporia cocos MD-104 SS10]|uniref:F-box domain-containing protein n=1 Tax=Wolfiporia cocos (strain MD-104) TaxID=742152 RepID=A0A2H3JBT6_WOLCO|nr:hypothetical protein WOLCODRAFT_22481 [Wolfiporia cocos MD-104 SS10]
MAANIPPEVFELIIDCVGFTNLPTQSLLACALVRRSWLPRSQRNLWRVVTFGKDRQLHLFHVALKAHPGNAELVRELNIVWRRTWDKGTLQRILNFPFVLARRLPNLQSIAVHSALQERTPILMTPKFFVALGEFSVCHLILNALRFRSSNDFCRVILALPRLSELECYDIRWEYNSPFFAGYPNGNLKLVSLSVGELTAEVLSQLLQIMDPALQHLKLDCTDLCYEDLGPRLLSGPGPPSPTTRNHWRSRLNGLLGRFEALITPEIRVLLPLSDGAPGPADILSPIKSKSLNNVTFQLSKAHIDLESSTELSILNNSLDDVLSGDQMPRLKEVSFIFRFDEASTDHKRYIDQVTRRLPKLAARDGVQITVRLEAL